MWGIICIRVIDFATVSTTGNRLGTVPTFFFFVFNFIIVSAFLTLQLITWAVVAVIV